LGDDQRARLAVAALEQVDAGAGAVRNAAANVSALEKDGKVRFRPGVASWERKTRGTEVRP
jgi:hypothetical protein